MSIVQEHSMTNGIAEVAGKISDRKIAALCDPVAAETSRLDRDSRWHQQISEFEQSLVGNSPAIYAIRQLVLEVAATRASVMIHGESGTGKELVARAIHRFSKQAVGPFVAVNMASIPPGMTESLLFGHEKG